MSRKFFRFITGALRWFAMICAGLLILIAADVKFHFIPYNLWHRIGIEMLRENVNDPISFDAPGDVYQYMTKLGAKIMVRGLDNIPKDKKIFCYHSHVAYYNFDMLSVYVYNVLRKQNAKFIALDFFKHPWTICPIHVDSQAIFWEPKYRFYPPTYLLDNGKEIVRQALNDYGAVFMMASGYHVSTLGYADRKKLYEYRHIDNFYEFKPGLLILSEGATLVPVRVYMDYPWWVRLIGRLPAIVVSGLHHSALTKLIYNNRILYVDFKKLLDDAQVAEDRRNVIEIHNKIKAIQVKLRENASKSDTQSQPKSQSELRAEVRAYKAEMQEILSKYADALYYANDNDGIAFESFDA